MSQPSTLSRISSGNHSLASDYGQISTTATSLTTIQKNKIIDQYVTASVTQLADAKTIESASSEESWFKQSWLMYTPLALLAITGCGGEDSSSHFKKDTGVSQPPPSRDAGNTSRSDAGFSNRAPVFGNIPNQTINEGQAFQFSIPVSDPDGDVFNVTAHVLTGARYPGGANVTIDSLRNYVFDWQPDYNQAGTYGITFFAYDGKAQTNADMQITVRDVPLDNDRDGFNGDVDCNDNDANTFPLRDGQTLNIAESVTVCPGTYEGARLNLTNANGLTVRGQGVIINAGGVFEREYEFLTGIISFYNAHHIDLSGFEIRNYGDGFVGLRLDRSNDNLLHDLFFHDVFDNFDQSFLGDIGGGIYVKDSSNNRILNAKILGRGVEIAIIGVNTYGNYVGDSEIHYTPVRSDILDPAIWVESNNADFENNILDGAGITVIGQDVIIRGNAITNAGTGVATTNSANRANINNNRINNCDTGINLTSDNNTLINNNLRFNTQCYTVDSGSTDNTISGNQCN